MALNKPASVPAASRFEPLTEAEIKGQTDSGSFSRGRAYFREGRIRETVLRENSIEGLCAGSDIVPYRVKSSMPRRGEAEGNLLYASCTCPRGGLCKHLVALLLTWIDDPGRFVERPPLAELLAERSRDELIALIEQMVQRYPELERLVDLPLPVIDAEGSANELSIDSAVIRRYAHTAFADVDAYDYENEWGAVIPGAADVYSLLELGQRYVAAGQWANAQVVFTSLAEETDETILSFPGEQGQLLNVITECDAGLSACLIAQAELPESDRLNEEERARLIKALYEIWQFGVFEAGDLDLAQHGFNALARHVTGDERAMVLGWLRKEQPDDWSKDDITGFQVRLRENSGLDDEGLLSLYREVEYWEDVASLLLRMDRVDDAVAIAVRHLTLPHDLIAFANALIERGGDHIGRAHALVDDRVWEEEGNDPLRDAMLQKWLLEQFSIHNRPRDALAIAERRFKRQPARDTYHEVRAAAGLPGQTPGKWAELRPILIAQLRDHKSWLNLVDIYLEEGEVAAALDGHVNLGKQRQQGPLYAASWANSDQELRLAQAAEAEFPDDAVAIYRQRAERMIKNRQRSSYRAAAEQLARAKETLERHGRKGKWNSLITEVRAAYKNLRALREELDALDL